MENYKIKLAVATMILSACVAAQPAAASAEEPDAALPPESAHQGQESAGEDEKQMAETADTAVAVIPESDASDAEETTAEEMVEEETAEVEAAEEEAVEEETAEEALAEKETTEEELTEEVPAEEEIAEEETAEEDTTAEKITEEATTEEGTSEESPAEEEIAEEETAEEDTTAEEITEEATTEEGTSEESSAEEEIAGEETALEETTEEVSAEEETTEEEAIEEETTEEGTSEEATPEEVVAEDNTAVPAGPMRAPSSTNNEVGLADISENESEDSSVAYIKTKDENGNETTTTYDSFDKAVEAAKDGDTIVLTKDAETAGLNLSKNLTVQGTITKNTVIKPDDNGNEIEETVEKKTKLTFRDKGIALWGKNLTFKDMEVEMKDVGSTPYTAEWNWMTICASKNASLTLDNTDMLMDGANAGNKHAIYFCSNNKLNIQNGSNLTIKNYQQDALEWDGGDGGYNVNITDSTFTSDHNRSGFTGTFYATIDNSEVNVINSTGNGSNGTYYTIKNNSDVTFDNNTDWGISAWRIDMTNNSTLTATNNGRSGIWTRVLNVDKTCTVDVEDNGRRDIGFTSNAGIFFQGNGTYKSVIEEGANVTIKNNAGSGIYTAQSLCNLTIGSAVIENNGYGSKLVENKVGATYGGGIYNIGTLVLGSDVTIQNNHAQESGGGIYNTGTVELAEGLIVKNNSASVAGGAIYNAEKAKATLKDNIEVLNNSAFQNGGGIYNAGTLELGDGLKFNGNIASANGGGLYNAGTLDAGDNVTIDANRASVSGGGIYNAGKAALGDNASISNNTASQCGGGIHNSGTFDLGEKAVIKYNYSSVAGGGLYTESGSATLRASSILNNNHAAAAGDDIFIKSGTLMFRKSNATGMNLNERLYDTVCGESGDLIDGWYVDAEGARWDAHGEKKIVTLLDDLDPEKLEGVTIVKNEDGSYSITVDPTTSTGFALKAAHAVLPEKPENPAPDEPGADDPVTPVTPIVKPEDPKAPVVIEEIPAAPEVPEAPAEEISAEPQVKLPQTGQNWALAGLLGAMGTLLASAGFASGKHSKSKRRKDEHEV